MSCLRLLLYIIRRYQVKVQMSRQERKSIIRRLKTSRKVFCTLSKGFHRLVQVPFLKKTKQISKQKYEKLAHLQCNSENSQLILYGITTYPLIKLIPLRQYKQFYLSSVVSTFIFPRITDCASLSNFRRCNNICIRFMNTIPCSTYR